MIYDVNFPSNDIALKDFPNAIREKGNSLFNYIKEVEKYRNANTFSSAIELFPEYKYLFLHSNSSIPSGLYFKGPSSWVGYSNFSFVPQNSDVPEGTRVSYRNQTYEMKTESEHKIWVNQKSFEPIIFFDFFETSDDDIELSNRGFSEQNVSLILKSYERELAEVIPFIKCREFTTIKTKETYLSKNLLSYSAIFKDISRLYTNDKPIDENAKAVLLSINDNLQNIRIGLCYDKTNSLFFYNKEEVTDLRVKLSSHLSHQIGLKIFNNKVTVILDNEELEPQFDIDITDKQLLFGLASDMGYGRYSNGSFLVSEPQIFNIAISKEEHLWLKNFPRTWSFSKDKTYLDLTTDEQLKLKKNINYLDMIEEHFEMTNKNLVDQINETKSSLNRALDELKNEVSNDISHRLSVIQTIQDNITAQTQTIQTLNDQLLELSNRITRLEQKL